MCSCVGSGVFLALIDRSGPSHDICHLRWQICKDWLSVNIFNSEKGDPITGIIRRENIQLSRFLTKKRDTQKAALIKAGLCSMASAEHGTSSETLLRTWLAPHVRRPAPCCPPPPPPTL